MPKSIMAISRDGNLLNLRAAILKRAGYAVEPVSSDGKVLGLLQTSRTFSLVLLCHTVPEKNRVYLAAQIKQIRPTLPILLLSQGNEYTEAAVDLQMHNLDSPTAWLQMIESLIATKESELNRRKFRSNDGRSGELGGY